MDWVFSRYVHKLGVRAGRLHWFLMQRLIVFSILVLLGWDIRYLMKALSRASSDLRSVRSRTILPLDRRLHGCCMQQPSSDWGSFAGISRKNLHERYHDKFYMSLDGLERYGSNRSPNRQFCIANCTYIPHNAMSHTGPYHFNFPSPLQW